MLTITAPVRAAAALVAGLLAATVAPLIVPTAAQAAGTTTAFTVQTRGTSLSPATKTQVVDEAVATWTPLTATTGELKLADADANPSVTLRNGSSGPFAVGTSQIFGTPNTLVPSMGG